MITREMIEERFKTEQIDLTPEHVEILNKLYGQIPFAMPELTESTIEVPEEYPGTIVWLNRISSEGKQTESLISETNRVVDRMQSAIDNLPF